MSRKRQKLYLSDKKSKEETSEPSPGCSRDLDIAQLSYQYNGDSIDVDGSLLTEELELLIPGKEFFLMEKRRNLYKRLADLYEALKLEDSEDKKKKKMLTPEKN